MREIILEKAKAYHEEGINAICNIIDSNIINECIDFQTLNISTIKNIRLKRIFEIAKHVGKQAENMKSFINLSGKRVGSRSSH